MTAYYNRYTRESGWKSVDFQARAPSSSSRTQRNAIDSAGQHPIAGYGRKRNSQRANPSRHELSHYLIDYQRSCTLDQEWDRGNRHSR